MAVPMTRTDVDLALLRDELTAALGRPVELSAVPAQTFTEPVTEDITEPVVIAELVEVEDEDGEVRTTLRARETGEQRVVGQRPTGKERTVKLTGELRILDPASGEELAVESRKVAAAVKAHQPTDHPAQRAAALTSAETKAAAGDTAGALADVLRLLRTDA